MATVVQDIFGTFTDPTTGKKEDVLRYTFKNGQFEVQVMNYGATILSVRYPDVTGKIDDVVLGFDTFEGYLASNNPYFGAVVGRVANRIGNSKFTLNGKEYKVTPNLAPNHLHGGKRGYDKVIWYSEIQGRNVVMTYVSVDGEEGYPGTVLNTVIYSVTEDNELKLEMTASATKPTPVNLTNHSYFNLAGHGSGKNALYKHIVSINADKYTLTNDQSIPTGVLAPVGGTLWDLRIPRQIGDLIPLIPGGGYDQNLCIIRSQQQDIAFVARAVHPTTGRSLEVYSNQPGVQLYTSNFFPRDTSQDPPGLLSVVTVPLIGRGGTHYYTHQAFCLETQNFPDAANHANFPSSILNPGQVYKHTVIYKFGVFKEVGNLSEKEAYITAGTESSEPNSRYYFRI